jgi:hypothetical protein
VVILDACHRCLDDGDGETEVAKGCHVDQKR